MRKERREALTKEREDVQVKREKTGVKTRKLLGYAKSVLILPPYLSKD